MITKSKSRRVRLFKIRKNQKIRQELPFYSKGELIESTKRDLEKVETI